MKFIGMRVRHKTNRACGIGRVYKWEASYDRYRVEWEYPERMSNQTHSEDQLIPIDGESAPRVTLGRMHPLHNADFIHDYMVNTGEYFPQERGTGRSTAQALGYIAEAVRNPFRKIVVVDHRGTAVANRELLHIIRRMVSSLRLEHFVFTNETIQFGE